MTISIVKKTLDALLFPPSKEFSHFGRYIVISHCRFFFFFTCLSEVSTVLSGHLPKLGSSHPAGQLTTLPVTPGLRGSIILVFEGACARVHIPLHKLSRVHLIFIIYLACVSVVWCHRAGVEVREQVAVSSVLLPCGSWGLTSDRQVWWQAPLSAELSHRSFC